MKNLKNRTIFPIVLVLILALSSILAIVPMVSAAEIPTYSFLTVNPNPIGVDQSISVNFWLDKVTPTAGPAGGDRWEGITITITKPDGSIETKGPYTLDAVASNYFAYTPTMTGKYYFEMHFPGQHLEGVGGWPVPSPFNNDYLESTSQRVELTVQDQAILHWEDYPVPSGYWTRPINAELRGIASIASNWLAAGATGPHGPRSYGYQGNYQPYGTAPNSAHVLWTREIAFGGVVGGEHGDNVYYPGETYERKFQPSIIMNGRLYYNQRLGSSSWAGLVCVDMNTGEQLWYKEGVTATFGQLLDMETPNQHGVIPYLWSVVGGYGPSTYKMYDAFSGDWILDISGVPSGSMILGESGEILIYTLNAAAGTLSLWNSTIAINPTIDSTWSWRPVAGASLNGSAGIQWTVTVPVVAGSSITKIAPDLIYTRATLSSGAATTVSDAAYDLKTKERLWTQERTYAGSLLNGPLSDGVFTTFVKEQMVWYGYDARTGAQLWGPTQPYTNGWGVYQPYADTQAGDGKLYAGGYDGIIHCYDIRTGENLWNYETGSSGFETPYGTYPMKDNAITIADGKVYVATNEHSPNTPYFHGWKLHCIDSQSGQKVWDYSFLGLAPLIADGRAVSVNYFDNRIYCFGTGPTATTVNVSPKVVTECQSVLIEGAVTDQSPGAKGTGAIAEAYMSEWMEHIYQQRPEPDNTMGVTVKLLAHPEEDWSAAIEIGTAECDRDGNFNYLWTPTQSGCFEIEAVFEGTASYGESSGETQIAIQAAAEPSNEPSTNGTSNDTLLIIGAIAIVLMILVLVVLLLKKK